MEVKETIVDFESFVENADILPVSPAIVGQVVESIASDALTRESFRGLVQSDASLMAKTFHLANLEEYSFPPSVEWILDHNPLLPKSDLSFCFYLINQAKELNGSKNSQFLQGIFQHSVTCAILCECVARQSNYHDPTEAYAAGLMHDIGKLALYKWAPKRYQEVIELYQLSNYSLHIFEKEIFGFDHARAGKITLQKWALPEEFIHVAASHHNITIQRGGFENDPLLSIVVHANELCRRFHEPNGKVEFLNPVEKKMFERLDYGRIFDETKERIDRYLRLVQGERSLYAAENLLINQSKRVFARYPSEVFKPPAKPKEFNAVESVEELLSILEEKSGYQEKIAQVFKTLCQSNVFKNFVLVFNDVLESEIQVYYNIESERSKFLKLKQDDNVEILTYKSPILLIGKLHKLLSDRKNTPPRLKEFFGSPDLDFSATCLSNQMFCLVVYQPLTQKFKSMEHLKGCKVVRKAADSVLKFICSKIQLQSASQSVWAHAIADEPRSKLEFQKQKLQSIGRLAAGMGHEINNPLTIIDLYLEKLKKEIEDASVQESLDIIRNSSKRIAHIVRNLMNLVGPSGAQSQKFKIHEAIKTAIDSVENRCKASGIEIGVHLPDASVAVFGDRHQIQQAILNLMLNAIQSMENGGLIEIKGKEIRVCNEFILSIRDTGKGMSSQELDLVFEPFYTTKKLGEGIGLGLITSKAIIEAHDGKIDVQSKPGEGTTVKITLPLCETGLDESAGAGSLEPARQDKSNGTTKFKIQSILIVDDEIEILDVIKDCLTPFGCKIETCDTSTKAFALIKNHAYDVAIIDYKIPGGSGIKIADYLIQNNFKTKIIMMSGESMDREIVKVQDQKPYPFLIKPFKLRTLLSFLEEFGLE